MKTVQSHQKRLSGQKPLVKVVFELPKDHWQSYESESMWAEDLGGGRYKLQNSPFAVYGYSFEDVVRAEDSDGRLLVTGPILRSGRSTFRIFLAENVSLNHPNFKSAWRPLQSLGCTLESATRRLIAVDVPPDAELGRVYELLNLGKTAGVWDCEEGHRSQGAKD